MSFVVDFFARTTAKARAEAAYTAAYATEYQSEPLVDVRIKDGVRLTFSASKLTLSKGSLILQTHDGELVAVFAPGEWKTVTKRPKPNPFEAKEGPENG